MYSVVKDTSMVLMAGWKLEIRSSPSICKQGCPVLTVGVPESRIIQAPFLCLVGSYSRNAVEGPERTTLDVTRGLRGSWTE